MRFVATEREKSVTRRSVNEMRYTVPFSRELSDCPKAVDCIGGSLFITPF